MKFFLKIFKEPLFHFILLGGVIFLVYYFVLGPVASNPMEIIVSQGKIKNLAEIFSRTWQRSPSSEELQGLVDDYIREEILYREGVRLGLDQNDSIIRRRVGQKMDFIIEDDAVKIEPSEAQLRQFFKEHIDTFRVEPKFSFRQIYFKTDPSGPNEKAQLQAKLNFLKKDPTYSKWKTFGDPSLLDSNYKERTLSEIKKIFGKSFAEQLKELPSQQWLGPVSSSYGKHLLWIEHQQAAIEPLFKEVLPQVKREWSYQQRKDMRQKFYQELRKNYRVLIKEPSEDAYAEANEEKK